MLDTFAFLDEHEIGAGRFRQGDLCTGVTPWAEPDQTEPQLGPSIFLQAYLVWDKTQTEIS